ncbi:MAG TPA: beta-L-arabinofuranosidase domain-containing protein, partial [Streptosporangiaceae bacterium]|nr:beta-L-arabinofuranosidase domain-containing protein [Streptosporangiaceae bacterium]
MADAEKIVMARGPVYPTLAARVAHRPLGGQGAQLTGGLLHDWQQRNRAASLPLALRQLEAAGNLDNLRLASAGVNSGYRGPAFMDSDVYKTLEAISWELGRAADSRLADFAAEATALLAKAQQDDGYLNSYAEVLGKPRYARLESSHELYCAGHLIQAAVAANRSFDGGALLQVARRFADHLVSVFLGGEVGLDGHPVIETALVELYRETGTDAYLELAAQFIDQRGHGRIGDSGFGIRYLQDHQPVREMTAITGHVVRALYLESGVVDVAVETGDGELLASSIARWDEMVTAKTALTGGNGSRHSGEAFGDAYELPPDRAYNETCAAIASFHWSWRLLLATGQARFADLMERILYNGFGAAVSADGRRFFYVNPLQRRDGHFENDDPGRRREWFSCACCPPNIMRLVASLDHYAATVADDVLYVHQLTGSGITALIGGGVLRVEVTTSYPWDGTVEFTVREAPAAVCGLAARIPGWSRDSSVRLNGQPVLTAADEHGYLLLRRTWQPGDVLSCTLDVTPRLTFPDRRIDAVRGAVAVERGPLVYCFEQ